MANVLTELVAKITADASGLKTGLDGATKATEKWAAKNARNIRAIGTAFTAIGAGITVGLGASTKAAVDFEDAFAGVRKTVDATEEEFEALSQGIRQLAKELPLAHEEIAGIAEAAGQLGIEKESIIAFTEVMAQLGLTTNMASQDAAMSLARFANITQMSQDSFERLGSVIVDLGNNMATTEEEIVNMGMRLAGAASTVGMTEAQIMGLAAALSSVGIRAERGGTAFARVMLEMNSAVASGGIVLEKWADTVGVTGEEFTKAFKEDSSKAVMSLIAAIAGLQEEGADVSAVLEELSLGGIRITDSLLLAAGAGDLFTNAQEIANIAWEENNALTEEASKRLETSASRMAILKNSAIDLGISIGEFILPLLKQLVDKIMPVVESVQLWIKENPALAKNIAIIGGIIGVLSLALGGLLLVLPGIITLWGAVGAVFAAITLPILGIVAAIAAVIVIGVLVVKNWEWIKTKVTMIWGGIKMFFLGVWTSIKDIFQNHWDKILAILFPAVGLPVLIARNWGKITEVVLTIWNGVVSSISSAWRAIVDFISSGVNWLIDQVNKVIGLINKVPGVNIGDISPIADESIPGFANGGTVPGPIGQPQLAIVHGGETITPAGSGVGGVTVNFTQPVFFDREDTMNKFVGMIRKEFQRQDRLRFGSPYSGG